MKIACLTTTFFPSTGGAEVCVYNLCCRYAAHGHDVTLYAPFSSYLLLRRQSPFRILPLVPKSDLLFRAMPALATAANGTLLRRRQALRRHDVWHIHCSYPAGYLVRKAFPGTPKALTCHGMDIQKDEGLSYGLRLDPRLEKRIGEAVRGMDALIAINEQIAGELGVLGAAPERIHRIPNGASWDRFSREVDRGRVRREVGIPEGVPLILTTGRYHPKKGFDLIPGIASALRAGGADFHWLIVGSGVSGIRERAESLNVADRITFTDGTGAFARGGHCLEVPDDALVDLYLAADVYALPSLLEGMPLVLPEAMAAGLAIATTDAPGCIDTIEDGETGLVAPAGDVSAFAECLSRFLGDPELRERVGRQARARRGELDWDVIAARHERLFEELIRSC